MRVLVTGGAGFIGSHVVTLLLQEDADVCIFDSFVGGKREENIPENVTVIEGDIRDQTALEKAMEGMTHVVHLAAQVSVPASIENPSLTHDVNVIGMQNILAAARDAGVTRVVYASSAAVYGDDPELPKTEKSLLLPKSPYALSKVKNEEDALASTLSTLGLRFFNVYGPHQEAKHPYASVIPLWIAAGKEGRPVELHGDGTQTRDFIHVHDVARAIVLGLKSSYTGVCNVASGVETTLRDVLLYIGEMFGKDLLYILRPARPGDITRSVADVSHAQEAIGFIFETPFQQGLRDIIP